MTVSRVATDPRYSTYCDAKNEKKKLHTQRRGETLRAGRRGNANETATRQPIIDFDHRHRRKLSETPRNSSLLVSDYYDVGNEKAIARPFVVSRVICLDKLFQSFILRMCRYSCAVQGEKIRKVSLHSAVVSKYDCDNCRKETFEMEFSA